jgi:hypothetical protein
MSNAAGNTAVGSGKSASFQFTAVSTVMRQRANDEQSYGAFGKRALYIRCTAATMMLVDHPSINTPTTASTGPNSLHETAGITSPYPTVV